MTFPVSVKNEIAEIFKKNGFECMSPGRGSQNPENWKGLGFHRARDNAWAVLSQGCLLYTSPSPRDKRQSRMPSSA